MLIFESFLHIKDIENNNHIKTMIKKQFEGYPAPEMRVLTLEGQLPIAQSPTGGMTVTDLTEENLTWD